MVATCFRIRAILAAMVGNHASEADRLRVEEHLALCESCRREKATMLLLENLRDQSPTLLSSSARDRVLSAVLAAPMGRHAALAPRRTVPRFAVVAALACAGAVAFGLGWKVRFVDGPAPRETASSTHAAPAIPTAAKETIDAVAAGMYEYGGARIRYQAGTAFRMHSRARHVELVHGQLDVDVTPGLPGQFRVTCADFSVEVLGTHFIVDESHVRTLHGKVRILNARGQEVAMLTAGQEWERQRPVQVAATVQAPSPSVAPSAAPVSAPASGKRAYSRPAPMGPSVEQLLVEARAVLGAGNPTQARSRIEQALDGAPTRRQRAIAELLAADTLLFESKYRPALAGYRRTVALFDGYPEAETAAYAIAQILTERGSADEAKGALARYLDRYPQGRFQVEASRKLATLSRP